ncbi:MAG: diaminopimelate decarboxylase [Pseudomonadota bacterium]
MAVSIQQTNVPVRMSQARLSGLHTAFSYKSGSLHVDFVPVQRIADEVGTPTFVYSATALRDNFRLFSGAFDGMQFGGAPVQVCYALKANSNLAVIKVFGALGAGADVVSEGELRRALAAGIRAEKIVFAGVGKTRGEMAFALDQGIHQFNVESDAELDALSEIAAAKGVRAPIAIRINPGVDAKTHAKISTGRKVDKFGIDIDRAREVFARAAALPGIDVKGIAIHIGSQLMDLSPFESAFGHVASLTEALREDGIPVERLDLGGGIGVAYGDAPAPDPMEYARIVQRTVGSLGCPVTFEPGRSFVADAGGLLTSVVYEKTTAGRRFIILDSAMNDLIRPTLYDAHHALHPAREPTGETSAADLVGPVCESGDTFAKQTDMPPMSPGDLALFASAGAYGAVMASTYNTRPLAPEVLVDGTQVATIKKRQTFEELIGADTIPQWLES